MGKYKITFTADYCQYEEWANEGDKFWSEKINSNRSQLAMCKKYKGKIIDLEDIPALIEEVGVVILSNDTVEIYNDYRE